MPKIGHLCFPIAFFGHFQYTRTDQERIPHSPSGGDFHGKDPWATFCPPPGHENDQSKHVHFHGKAKLIMHLKITWYEAW
ncbi:hypothetical protein AVP43_00211 [Geobacillus stearothermophilus]|nr:hypothetical protein AVP43_00211 [Geobacillus stearothermophilus]